MSVALQRPLRGSRISTFYPVKSLPSLASLDSAFQLQEYISLLIRLDPHDVDHIVAIPKGKEKDESDKDKSQSDVTVDEACWIYEQLRRLAQDLSHPLITVLQQECTRATCPEMKAGEWLYLCVAHGNENNMEQCCAIDYIIHTLDSATALLNSPRAFPSRLSIPQTSYRHFSSLARRLGRIFAHAYFHHRDAFEQAEAESSLYARFLALTSRFDLVPQEFLVIPPRAADDDEREEPSARRTADVEPPRIHAAAALDPAHEREIERQRSVEHGSPRKTGRSRTDTMVFSEAYNVVEEMARTLSDEAHPEQPVEEEPAAVSAEPEHVDEPEGPAEEEPAPTVPEVQEEHAAPVPESEPEPEPEPEPASEEVQAETAPTEEVAEEVEAPAEASSEAETTEDPFGDGAAAPEDGGEGQEEVSEEAEKEPPSSTEEASVSQTESKPDEAHVDAEQREEAAEEVTEPVAGGESAALEAGKEEAAEEKADKTAQTPEEDDEKPIEKVEGPASVA
ncbi:Mob1/phocein [Punctularia strigosozonata HHB-11173 SS5]|uniref:Mob1/phocein n=1 Tax=Punctularia strigosozonata (strain HHB-11173) TaxID=741275 RepID=UPI0004417E2C|nr:Mob1/phocein [Punctularia strigosozonata HHB-11173 SS5]EIN09080.1 Mob1/phocein [Punctularia strigosozonata HHB-11173 SS5]